LLASGRNGHAPDIVLNPEESARVPDSEASPLDKHRDVDGNLAEGWYLMNTPDLERELIRGRLRETTAGIERAMRLTIEEALTFRDAGNVPDEHGRTLRLVLMARNPSEVRELPTRRLLFEPDYLDRPKWRREGSKPVNVVPVGAGMHVSSQEPWWEEPELAALESDWLATGTVDGLRVPEKYRGFVYKTILTLRGAGREVTIDGIVDSLARWLGPGETVEIRSALEQENQVEP
jgi:hypothetical protein